MGVRPPQGDDDDSGPASVDFGIAALAAEVDRGDIEFPATAAEIRRALDDPQIAYDPHGNSVALSEVLDAVPRQKYESKKELLNALHPAFEELRTSSGRGILGWVRSLFPG